MRASTGCHSGGSARLTAVLRGAPFDVMRRTTLLVTGLVAACNVYDTSLLTGGRAGDGAGGSTGGAAGASGSGGVSESKAGNGSGLGGGSGGAPLAGAGGGGTSSGTLGEGGMDAESGAGGEGDPGLGGSAGAGSGGKSGGNSGRGGGGAGGASAGGGGRGGAAGSAGGAGASGAAGTSAAAGAGGSAGAGGAETCGTGCARMSVPLAVLNDRTHYSFSLGGEADFSIAVVTYRVRKVSATGGRIWAYVQHGGTPDYNLIYGGSRNFDQLGSDWTTVTWDVGATVPGFTFDKTAIARVGIEIVASGTGPWTSPTVVYLDSLSVTGPNVGPWPFDDGSTVSSASSAPAGVFWMSTNDPDELVVGSLLGWVP